MSPLSPRNSSNGRVVGAIGIVIVTVTVTGDADVIVARATMAAGVVEGTVVTDRVSADLGGTVPLNATDQCGYAPGGRIVPK